MEPDPYVKSIVDELMRHLEEEKNQWWQQQNQDEEWIAQWGDEDYLHNKEH